MIKVKYFKTKKKDLHSPPDDAVSACHLCLGGKTDVISFDAFEMNDGSLRLFLPDEVKNNLITL